jgi:hypothetical protein
VHRQLLITLLVAAIVIALARVRRGKVKRDEAPPKTDSGLPTGAVIGYALAALTILASAGFGWHWYQDAHRIVQVEVVESTSGQRTVYQVYRKDLGTREFRTVDGRYISLGASDRMERVE